MSQAMSTQLDYGIEPLEGRVLLSATPAIYITTPGGGGVADYTVAGKVVNKALIGHLRGAGAAALSGSDLFVGTSTGKNGSGMISEYTTAGARVKVKFITKLNNPVAIDVVGKDIYVLNRNFATGNGTVDEYNTRGKAVAVGLVSNLVWPTCMTIKSSIIYIGCTGLNNAEIGTFLEYTASTGASVILPFTPIVPWASGIAVIGSHVFITDYFNGNVGEYDGTTGETIDSEIIAGTADCGAIAASGANLFVADEFKGFGTVGEYTDIGNTISNTLFTLGTTPVPGICLV